MTYQRISASEIIGKYGILGIHPAAEIFPFATDEEFQSMCVDVKKRGFIHAIRVNSKKLLLDGRTRLEIANATGVDPIIEHIDPQDILGYVISENLQRRHLTLGQRAAIAEKLANQPHGRPSEKDSKKVLFSREQAAGKLGTSRASLERARAVRKWAPEELKKVEAGTMKLEPAYQIACKNRKAAKVNNKLPVRRDHYEEMSKIPKLPELTREQVDPNFKGDALAFATEYGHVVLQTKEERDKDRDRFSFSSWVGAMKKLKIPLKELLKAGPFKKDNIASWIRRTADPAKIPARYAEMEEMLTLVKQAGDSVAELLEWLPTQKPAQLSNTVS